MRTCVRCVHVYTHMYVCIYMYVYIYTHSTHTHTHTHTCIMHKMRVKRDGYVYVRVCKYACMHTYMHEVSYHEKLRRNGTVHSDCDIVLSFPHVQISHAHIQIYIRYHTMRGWEGVV